MKFIDDKKKNLKWWNRNYFWLGTIIYALINIVIFACFGTNTKINTQGMTGLTKNLADFYNGFISSFSHVDWSHCLHNMLGMSFAAFYIERKYGSFPFLGLTILFSVFFSIYGSFTGSSLVWFALFGFVLIDFLFSFRKNNRNATNIIVGSVSLILEFVRSCFYDKAGGGIGIGLYPYQLLGHSGHFMGFILGMFLALFLCVVLCSVEKNQNKNII